MELELAKAMYRPGETVCCRIHEAPAAVSVRWSVHHLDQPVLRGEVRGAGDMISFSLPQQDRMGYMLTVCAMDEHGNAIAQRSAGIDCSSSWTAFPRYGYVWDYTDQADPEQIIAQLSRYHLNGLQFYDWQYRHHIPLSPDPEAWHDWSGRRISGAVIRRYIQAAHKAGIACMAYNMIYAANQTYLTDGSGVSPAWRLIKPDGTDFTCDMDASLGDVGILQYFNPLDPRWQQYIFQQEKAALDAFDFDGWHGDTIGELGPMKTADGQPLGKRGDGTPIFRVKDCYTQFLNAAKQAVSPKYLTFNPVGAQGIEAVNISRVDALYTEFWPWDQDDRGAPYDDYYSIHRAILRAAAQSGGKSLIVAGYINYKNPAAVFNEPAVRLMDSVVYASGGSRIELGNGDGMLSNEYFPDDRHKRLSSPLREAVRRMYDFVTAYQNILRGGLVPTETDMTIDAVPTSSDGESDTVWHFSRTDGQSTICHLINLRGTDNEWRDVAQEKKAPVLLHDLSITLRTAHPVHSVFAASPDTEDLSLRPLPFSAQTDAAGTHLSFVLPQLAYWDLILMR